MEEKKLTDELEKMYVSGKFNGEIVFNAIKTIYALQAELEELHTLTDMPEANVRKMFENNMSLRKEIEQLTTRCEIAEGTKNRLTIFDRIEIHDKAVKDTAKKFADLVEFHSIARMNDGVEYFTISALGLKEILVEEFGFKYSELNGVEVE